jgi:hypothetical protein
MQVVNSSVMKILSEVGKPYLIERIGYLAPKAVVTLHPYLADISH